MPTLLDSLKSAVERELAVSGFLFDRSDFGFMYNVLAQDKGVLKQVQSILESAEIAKREISSEQLVNAIFSGDNGTIRKFAQSGLNTNIFRTILDSEVLKTKLLTVGSKAPLLDRYLQSEYIRISNSKEFHRGENPDISELIHRVETFTNESVRIGKIDRFNLNNLLKTLKEVLKKFSE
ncbi:hypothetical protein U7537_00215 [Lacticaseibacillus rhamnosus]